MNITSFKKLRINNDPFTEIIRIIQHFLGLPSTAIKQGNDSRENYHSQIKDLRRNLISMLGAPGCLSQ